MPHDSNSNAPSSAKTSSKRPATPLTEAQYLAKQQADAQKAITRTLAQLKLDLVKTADPRAWMNVHPWATLGAAAVAGFAAAATVVPSKEQQALKKLRELEEALEAREHPERDGNGRKKSTMSGIGGMVFRIIQPMIISTLTGFLSGKAAAEPIADPQAGPMPESQDFTTQATPTGVDAGI
jgi:hypothetical protein